VKKKNVLFLGSGNVQNGDVMLGWKENKKNSALLSNNFSLKITQETLSVNVSRIFQIVLYLILY
jgi:hypothetical protein